MLGNAWRKPPKTPRWISSASELVLILAPAWIGITRILPIISSDWLTFSTLTAVSATVAAAVSTRIAPLLFDRRKYAIDAVLKVLGDDLLTNSRAELLGGEHRHRVTLFELRRRNRLMRWIKPKWTHKLVPRTRVPLSGKLPTRSFRVNHHEHEHCEGIAGRAFEDGIYISDVLPDLHHDTMLMRQSSPNTRN